MKVVASAPGRAGIIGNPTDGYGGCVISCTIAERAVVSIAEWDRLSVRIGEAEQEFRSRKDFRLCGDRFDCVRAVLSYMRLFDQPMRIEIDTQIPIKAGLAGSTAILTSLKAGLQRFLGLPPLAPHLLAETVRTIELNYLEIQCGYQDQYMTVFGGLCYMDFRSKEWYRDLPHEVFATIEDITAYVPERPFLLAHTGRDRISGQVLRPLRERWEEGQQEVVQGYQRIAELARLGKRAMIEGNWPHLARLMNENHEIQRRLGASGEVNDYFVSVALAHGALGAKLAGAGGGGTIICLTHQPQRVAQALREAGAAQILSLCPSKGVDVQVLP